MSQAVHPFITQLTRYIDEVNQLLQHGAYLESWRIMKQIIENLRNEDRPKDMYQELCDSITYIDGLGGTTAQRALKEKRVIEHTIQRHVGRNWWNDLMKLLWEKEYLINEGYDGSFFDPSQGKESGGRYKR